MDRYRAGLGVAFIVFVIDQVTKWLVTGPLGLNRIGDQSVLLPIFNLTYVENNGISLGLFNATTAIGRWMLVAVTSAIAVAVAVWIGREKGRIDQIALGMVLGGALGNILDRVRHGYVTDHIVPLACGGADAPSNMQWQTIEEAKAKDRVERQGCGSHSPAPRGRSL